jgi:hypothetical protein
MGNISGRAQDTRANHPSCRQPPNRPTANCQTILTPTARSSRALQRMETSREACAEIICSMAWGGGRMEMMRVS